MTVGGEPAAYRIERVTRENLPHYRAVRLAMLLDTPRAFGSTYAATFALPDKEWLRRVETHPVWLAWDTAAGRPVGSIAMYPDQMCAEGETLLVGMWVAAPSRGRGVAEELVAVMLADARERGFRRVLLDVAEENTPARGLYERLGFRATGQRWVNEAVDDGVDEIQMALDL